MTCMNQVDSHAPEEITEITEITANARYNAHTERCGILHLTSAESLLTQLGLNPDPDITARRSSLSDGCRRCKMDDNSDVGTLWLTLWGGRGGSVETDGVIVIQE